MSRRSSRNVEPDTITYRFDETGTGKSYEVVTLNAAVPSSEIFKLEPTWLFKTITTGDLAKDICLRVHAHSHSPEPFAWSASRLVIEDDAMSLLIKRPRQAKRKPCSTTLSKEAILGNGDIVEFHYDFMNETGIEVVIGLNGEEQGSESRRDPEKTTAGRRRSKL